MIDVVSSLAELSYRGRVFLMLQDHEVTPPPVPASLDWVAPVAMATASTAIVGDKESGTVFLMNQGDLATVCGSWASWVPVWVFRSRLHRRLLSERERENFAEVREELEGLHRRLGGTETGFACLVDLANGHHPLAKQQASTKLADQQAAAGAILAELDGSSSNYRRFVATASTNKAVRKEWLVDFGLWSVATACLILSYYGRRNLRAQVETEALVWAVREVLLFGGPVDLCVRREEAHTSMPGRVDSSSVLRQAIGLAREFGVSSEALNAGRSVRGTEVASDPFAWRRERALRWRAIEFQD